MTYHSASLPQTSDKLSGFNRLKVDQGQTSFFEGREFRTFKELNIPALTTYVIKVVVPGDIIFTQFITDIESGHLRASSVGGGTPTGTFAETLPIFMRNNMSVGPNKRYNPTAGVVMTAGGAHTGGTELDVTRIKTVTAQGNQSSTTVGGVQGDERGIAAGTYHFRLQNLHATEAVVGVLHASWEERLTPPASAYA